MWSHICFCVTQEAERAKVGLDGKKALGRKIIVDWARTDYGLAKKTVSTRGNWSYVMPPIIKAAFFQGSNILQMT